MAIFSESESRIFGQVMYDIIHNTTLSRSSPGSKTRALAQAVSRKMGYMYRKFDVNMVQAYLNGASGKYLGFIGSMMGVSRLGEEAAETAAAQKVVKFYVETGTFGDINNSTSILVPAGHHVSTAKAATGIVYRLPYAIYLPLDTSELYISAEATHPGTEGNVGANQLIYHDFLNYADVLNDTLKVANVSDIATGTDFESDTNYRFRIANQTVAAEKGNRTAVRLAALMVPGVADIIELPYFHGIGSFDILIKSTSPSVPTGLLDAIEEAVADVASWGIVPYIRGPIETGMSLTATLILRRKVPIAEQNTLMDAVRANLRTYINNLDIGEDWVVNEAVERVMATSDLIKNMGTQGKPFDAMYIHHPTDLEDNKIRSALVWNYKPEPDEKLLVEDTYAGATPVSLSIST